VRHFTWLGPVILALHWLTGWNVLIYAFNGGLVFTILSYLFSTAMMQSLSVVDQAKLYHAQVVERSVWWVNTGSFAYCGAIAAYLFAHDLYLTLATATTSYILGSLMMYRVLTLKTLPEEA